MQGISHYEAFSSRSAGSKRSCPCACEDFGDFRTLAKAAPIHQIKSFFEAAKLCAAPLSSQIPGQGIDGYVNMNVNLGVPSSMSGVPVGMGHLPGHTHSQTMAPTGVGIGIRHARDHTQIHTHGHPHSHSQVPIVGMNQVQMNLLSQGLVGQMGVGVSMNHNGVPYNQDPISHTAMSEIGMVDGRVVFLRITIIIWLYRLIPFMPMTSIIKRR